MKRWKWFVLVGIVFTITIIAVWKCAWDIRGDQYRRYAAQSLKDVILGSMVQIKNNVEINTNNGELLKGVGHRFQETDMLRQKLQNIYKEKDPGMISISPSVWMDCGAVLLILSDETKLTSDQVSFLEDLSDLCQTYVEVFSSEGQTIDEFEYYLYELEEKLEVLLQPMRYLLNN